MSPPGLWIVVPAPCMGKEELQGRNRVSEAGTSSTYCVTTQQQACPRGRGGMEQVQRRAGVLVGEGRGTFSQTPLSSPAGLGEQIFAATYDHLLVLRECARLSLFKTQITRSCSPAFPASLASWKCCLSWPSPGLLSLPSVPWLLVCVHSLSDAAHTVPQSVSSRILPECWGPLMVDWPCPVLATLTRAVLRLLLDSLISSHLSDADSRVLLRTLEQFCEWYLFCCFG